MSHLLNNSLGYNGNCRVKRDGVIQNFTQHQIEEYVKCSRDPSYFARKYIKVISVDKGTVPFDLYPYQEKMYERFTNNRFNIVLACRQSGKSTAVMGYLLWYALFHPEKNIAIAANKGAMAREILARITFALENLPFFLQPGCKTLNKGSIHFSNDTKIIACSTSSSALRGESVALLYLDEFAFVENAEKFYTSTYPVISAGKESRVIITSTANGVGNPFYNIYEGAKTGKNEYIATRVDWWDVPGRDDSWKRQTIANTSERQFEQEFGNAFHSTGSTLIAGDCLLRINTEKPIKSTDSWNIYADPEEGHIYVLSIDVALGRGGDYSAATLIDISSSPFKQIAVYRNNRISPMLLADAMVPVAKKYNNAHIIVEVNNGGSQVANDIYHDYEYENMHLESAIRADGVGLTMNKKTKRIGCSHLKDLIESGQLQIVDTQTLQELSTFSVSGSSYAATQGNHDDIVMTLVSFAFVMQTLLSDEDKSLKDLLFDKLAENIEEDLLPPGIFDDRNATDSAPKSMEIHERMIKDIDDWNL
jgi:hypothetical protein